MKKLICILSITLFTLYSSFAQTDSTYVPFVASWAIGDNFTFKINKSYSQVYTSGKTVSDSIKYTARFNVLDSTENSYTIQWSFLNNKYLPIFIDESVKKLTPELPELEIIYKTTETGEFISILNWQEMSSKFNRYYSQLILATENNRKLQQKVVSQLKPFETACKTKEGVELFMFKELSYIHYPFGVLLPTSEAVYYEDQFPNLFGGAPLRANAKLEFEHVDYDEEYCRFRQNAYVNADDAKNMLFEFIKKNYTKSREVKKIIKESQIIIFDDNVFEYYYTPGIPININILRRIDFSLSENGFKRDEKVSIELIK